MKFLGIDTSNYTTSAALADENGIVINLRKLLPVAPGAAGLRQSDAVFHHTVRLPDLMEELGSHDITAIAYSARPRDVEGSYMPCFLVGATVARALASMLGVPAYPISHQRGHLTAALYGAGRMDLLGGRYLAFHVSGGTTDLVLADGETITPVGGTADLNAGQAIDRIGLSLGLTFPCGPALEALAAEWQGETPKPRVSVKATTCHLSGLENQAKHMLAGGATAPEVAAYTLRFIGETLAAMTAAAKAEYGADTPVIYAGGVMSNRYLQTRLAGENTAFAEPAFSADNAAGVALCARAQYLREQTNGKERT